MQLNSMATSFAFQWPSEVNALMSAQKALASIGNSIVSVDCLANDSGNKLPMFFLKSLVLEFRCSIIGERASGFSILLCFPMLCISAVVCIPAVDVCSVCYHGHRLLVLLANIFQS